MKIEDIVDTLESRKTIVRFLTYLRDNDEEIDIKTSEKIAGILTNDTLKLFLDGLMNKTLIKSYEESFKDKNIGRSKLVIDGLCSLLEIEISFSIDNKFSKNLEKVSKKDIIKVIKNNLKKKENRILAKQISENIKHSDECDCSRCVSAVKMLENSGVSKKEFLIKLKECLDEGTTIDQIDEIYKKIFESEDMK